MVGVLDVTLPGEVIGHVGVKIVTSDRSLRSSSAVSWWQRQFALITISFGIFSVLSIWFVASAVVKPLRLDWGISDAQASFLTSMVNIGFVFGCMANAILNTTDLVNPSTLICIGAIGGATANATLLLGIGFYPALAVRFLVGLFLSLVYPPSVKLLSTWFPAEHRAYAIGVMFNFFGFGVAFPQLLVFVAIERSWQPIVIGTSATAFICGICVYTCVRVGPYTFPTSTFEVNKCKDVFCDRSVALSILAYCGHQWEAICVFAWIGTFLERIWEMTPSSVPLLAFAIMAMSGPGAWAGGALGDRFGRVEVAIAALSTSGLCLLVLALLADEGPLVLRISVCLLWGFMSLLDSPNYSALVSENADQKYVGTAISIQLMCGYLVAVVALWVVPAMAVYISWRWSFALLCSGPFMGVSALLGLRGKEYKGK